jgi:hypothetical protein
MEGSDVDMLWNGSEDEGTECEDGDSDTDWWRYTESDIFRELSVLN